MNRKFTIAILAALSLSAIGITSLSLFKEIPGEIEYKATAENASAYSLTVNGENFPDAVKTTSGYPIGFSGEGYSLGASIELSKGAYIGNTAEINVMTGIKVTFSGSLTLSLGYQKGMLYEAGDLSSGALFGFPALPSPRFFKLSANEATYIQEIAIEYNCVGEDTFSSSIYELNSSGFIKSIKNNGMPLAYIASSDAKGISESYASNIKVLTLVGEIDTNNFYAQNMVTLDLSLYQGKIPGDSFHNCLKLKNVILGPSLTRLATSTFLGCDELENVFIMDRREELEIASSKILPSMKRYYSSNPGGEADQNVLWWSYNELGEPTPYNP